MNGLEVQINGDQSGTQPLLVTIVRRDEGSLHGDYQACHLFAYHGTAEVHEALKAALNDYLSEDGDYYRDEDGRKHPHDWFNMMAEREDYGEIFAKHGLTEVRIPMGMVSIVFDNNDQLAYYTEG